MDTSFNFQELAVRGKNKKERFQGFMASFQKSGDELLLSNTLKVNFIKYQYVKSKVGVIPISVNFSLSHLTFMINGFQDVDEFFDAERTFLLEYHGHLKEATHRSDRMTTTHKVLTKKVLIVNSL